MAHQFSGKKNILQVERFKFYFYKNEFTYCKANSFFVYSWAHKENVCKQSFNLFQLLDDAPPVLLSEELA